MTIAMYALSGDPITYGHIDIIERASKSFTKLIVGLGVNPKKKYLLTSIEREHVAKKSLAHLQNVEVKFFDGLLVDFAYENNVSVIVRGIRNASDATEEQALDQINYSQMNIETMFMFSRSKLAHVSSSSVKALQAEHGNIIEYVPLPVKKIIEKKVSNQLIYGVTGVMGSGKSFVAQKLVEYAQLKNAESSENPLVFNLELDFLAHKVYTEDKPVYEKIRQQILSRFGTLDRKKIGEFVFSGEKAQENLDFINDLFAEPLNVLLRQEMRGKEGVLLINAALLIERNILGMCNNDVILVKANDDLRKKRLLSGRGIPEQVADDRVKHVLSNEEKEEIVRFEIRKANTGSLIIFDNNVDNTSKNIEELYTKLVVEYKK